MSVLVVAVTGDIELRHLGATFGADRLTLRVLLADQGLDAQLAELEVGLDTKQRLATTDKRRVQIHRHISCLDGLDDIVFVSLVVELEVLLIKGETGLGVIVEVEVDFLAHFTIDRCLYFLVKIEDIVIPCPLGE